MFAAMTAVSAVACCWPAWSRDSPSWISWSPRTAMALRCCSKLASNGLVDWTRGGFVATGGVASAGAAFGQPDYVSRGCGMGREATLYLLERGVRVTGIDGWSWDAPFIHTKAKYAETHDASLIWEGHRAGREIGYCHIEKLHNLDKLPAKGFSISCFPVKIHAASAGWTRAIAIID